MFPRLFQCTPEYFNAEHDNLYLEDVFPVDTHTHNYWRKCSRKAHEYNVRSVTIYEVYHKAAMWPHIFTCLTIMPIDTPENRDNDFVKRDLTQIALHRYQNKDVALGSFVSEAVVYGMKRMVTNKRPTELVSVHFSSGLRLSKVLDLFHECALDFNRFETYTKNCMWFTGSILWDTLAENEQFLSIPSRATYTEFVTSKMQPMRQHGMMPWLRWRAPAFWASNEAAWTSKSPLSKADRLQRDKALLAISQRELFLKEGDRDADTKSIEELKERIKKLADDIDKADR